MSRSSSKLHAAHDRGERSHHHREVNRVELPDLPTMFIIVCLAGFRDRARDDLDEPKADE
jgi:hypothetical protein